VAGNEPEREGNTGSTGGSGSPPEPSAARAPEPASAAAAGSAAGRTEPEQSLSEVARARRRRVTKAVVAGVIVIVLVLFIVANSQPVEADFLVFKAHPRLIWVMVTCAVLGIVLGYLLGRPGHEGKPRKKKDGGAPAG
jgi:uncharacterized integral membrane protein